MKYALKNGVVLWVGVVIRRQCFEVEELHLPDGPIRRDNVCKESLGLQHIVTLLRRRFNIQG